MRTYTFTVEGSIQFPMDMLRYDACWPSTTEDVAIIASTLDVEARLEQRRTGKPFKVTISSISNNLTKARWSSFGWKVTK